MFAGRCSTGNGCPFPSSRRMSPSHASYSSPPCAEPPLSLSSIPCWSSRATCSSPTSGGSPRSSLSRPSPRSQDTGSPATTNHVQGWSLQGRVLVPPSPSRYVVAESTKAAALLPTTRAANGVDVVQSIALHAPAPIALPAEELQLVLGVLDDHQVTGSAAGATSGHRVQVPFTPACVEQLAKCLHDHLRRRGRTVARRASDPPDVS